MANLEKWVQSLIEQGIFVEGEIEIWDDGYEQQGIYVQTDPDQSFEPISTLLLADLDQDADESPFGDFPMGKLRITIKFERIE